MISRESIQNILKTRKGLRPEGDIDFTDRDQAAEGGCGVIGMASSEQVAGRHLLQALDQMKNRGNGKGGGIAAVGLLPKEWGVSQEILDNDYLLSVAYLDPSSREEVEQKHIHPIFDIDHVHYVEHIPDFRALDELDVEPPEVWVYFVRVKKEVRENFKKHNNLWNMTDRRVEDEIVYQNTYKLNKEFYAAAGETRAFVLSHGKNLLVLKMVGYGDDVVRYYKLENIHAHVWIGHHRYPTKGRVWHPGGAHPFIGLNEALVHNGDFANYASISEYLAQRDIYPLFLTDTEVSAQVFDLLHRTYDYPLEYVIESIAPTTERDFTKLPLEKQKVYGALQHTHIHASPDGPWFFLIAQSGTEKTETDAEEPVYRFICITDTSMLRPQVFAWQQHSTNGPSIGFAASEKQGIDAALTSLAAEDERFWSRADRYWNARGGSHTDGGAFIFSVKPAHLSSRADHDSAALVCTDKFGRNVTTDPESLPFASNGSLRPDGKTAALNSRTPGAELFKWAVDRVPQWAYDDALTYLNTLEIIALTDEGRTRAIETLTLLMDRRYPTGTLRRSSFLSLIDRSLANIVESIREIPSENWQLVEKPYSEITPTKREQQTVVFDARGFTPEGETSVAREIVRLYQSGFCKFMVTHARGHRFIGNGFGPGSEGVRIDLYGSPGDYLASGIDGMEIHVHNNAQDQLAQIMKAGKLVVHGDVGQTFGYAAKGGEVYVLGNAAGRPLINAVGKPRVVINGTCLDYLAESFMAGNPYNGGGFVILNGITLTDDGEIEALDLPYPGGNLFSLASGGAIYVRDPHGKVTEDQLNGGQFFPFTQRDWDLILPYLEENARQFGIPVDALLEVDGVQRRPEEIYRRIAPAAVRALLAEEIWSGKK